MLHDHMVYDQRIIVRMDRRGETLRPILPEGLRTIGVGFEANGNLLHDVASNLCFVEDLETKRHAG